MIRPMFAASQLAVAMLFFNLGSADAAEASPMWNASVAAALRTAAVENRPIVVFVTAKWCGFCRKMERETLANPQVARKLRDSFVVLMIDADEQPNLVERMRIEGFPSTLVFSPSGKLRDRATGYLSPAEASQWLDALNPKPSVDLPGPRQASAT